MKIDKKRLDFWKKESEFKLSNPSQGESLYVPEFGNRVLFLIERVEELENALQRIATLKYENDLFKQFTTALIIAQCALRQEINEND